MIKSISWNAKCIFVFAKKFRDDIYWICILPSTKTTANWLNEQYASIVGKQRQSKTTGLIVYMCRKKPGKISNSQSSLMTSFRKSYVRGKNNRMLPSSTIRTQSKIHSACLRWKLYNRYHISTIPHI